MLGCCSAVAAASEKGGGFGWWMEPTVGWRVVVMPARVSFFPPPCGPHLSRSMPRLCSGMSKVDTLGKHGLDGGGEGERCCSVTTAASLARLILLRDEMWVLERGVGPRGTDKTKALKSERYLALACWDRIRASQRQDDVRHQGASRRRRPCHSKLECQPWRRQSCCSVSWLGNLRRCPEGAYRGSFPHVTPMQPSHSVCCSRMQLEWDCLKITLLPS